jgi:hypothetical protein
MIAKGSSPEANKRIKHGTAKSLLGSALLHILANNFLPIISALAVQG